MTKYVGYCRVSTKEQGQSGLGLTSQKQTIDRWISTNGGGDLIQILEEKESGTRGDRKRKQLRKALELCQQEKATLIVAKADRLTRKLEFLSVLRNYGYGSDEIVVCDQPDFGSSYMNKYQFQESVNRAELEAAIISERTKNALAVKKQELEGTGERLGTPDPHKGSAKGTAAWKAEADELAIEVGMICNELKKYGCGTLQKLKEGLEARGVRTARGKTSWALSSVSGVLKRYKQMEVASV